jgi:hypothetical protein
MPDKPKIIKTTIRIERSLWNRVRVLAIENGTSAEALTTLVLKELVNLTPKEIAKELRKKKGGK